MLGEYSRALLNLLVDSHLSAQVADVNTPRCPSASLTYLSGSCDLDTAKSGKVMRQALFNVAEPGRFELC
jgi:hypothetical protein